MISESQVLLLHDRLIQLFGGSAGLRDQHALSAALARPFATFGGEELLPRAEQKAAAILESILINHPFVDGNKRTGYVLMDAILRHAGIPLFATEEEKYSLVIEVASGKTKSDQVFEWLKYKTR